MDNTDGYVDGELGKTLQSVQLDDNDAAAAAEDDDDDDDDDDVEDVVDNLLLTQYVMWTIRE